MPTLLQISIEVNTGSVGRIAEQIGQLVIDHGWNSYITYARNHLPSKSNTIKIGSKFGIYWHAINTRLFDNHCLCSTITTKKMIKQIEEIKPDIIQLHHIHGYYLNMQILFNYLSRLSIPIIWIFHDCWSFTGHCAYYDYIGCDKWIYGCFRCPQKSSYPASRFLDRSKKNWKLKKQLFNTVKNMTIVPVSYWLGSQVEKSFFGNYPIKVIQNGIDIEIFHPIKDIEVIKKKYKIEDKFIILGVASTWDERKGLKNFISLNSVLDPEVYQIILIGLNRKQIKNLPKEIIGLKRTDNINELISLYSIADVHISCSVEESFGLTIIESLACGTPVIVFNCTAFTELIDNYIGFIVERGDIKGLYKSILKIRENKKEFYSENCRRRAETLYDKQIRFADYLNLFNQLLVTKTK